ncbi:transcriptional regulator, AraC family protein [Synechococcus sp. PCC 7335]|uniref:helix-turn-helix domain-containing protein n=1 Tax=Synechococcus sp. (strain ATCC 29403 / PCC 7335) TaxID=91464 RepID=UPI00017EE07C|nr:AraC family transcriptional regulator [Synechococcus sp. PCC 7335]EDX86650.1 transcriptional regulator, AraC family protein [Synechococcus sp. PCC 7335]
MKTTQNQTPVQKAPIQIQQLHNPAGEGSCHFKGKHTLFMSLSSRPVHYLQAQDGKTHTGLYRRGDILITPADTPLFVRWEGDEDCLQIQLTDEFVKEVARETVIGDSDHLSLMPTFQAHNPQLESISQMLLNEYQQGSLANQLYLDSLTNVLTVTLLREHTITQPQLAVYEGGLPQYQLRRILEYIDAHLDQDIKLVDLAGLLDMSQFHFSRLFKQSVGISPYQYLIQQRVERAKQLLKQTDRLITDIALDCGFSSHSHLSKQFRQLTGVTPKAFRSR